MVPYSCINSDEATYNLAMIPHEIESFVGKFRGLWLSGQDAELNMSTKNGKAWISLNLGLGDFPSSHQPMAASQPPYQPTFRPCPSKNSPSRQRRRARRLVARETAHTGVVSETTQTTVEDDVLANVEEKERKATVPAIEDDDAEEALRNAGAKSNLTDGVQSNNAEEAFAEKSDEKSNSQHPEAYTAEQADIPKYNYDAEKASEPIKSKSKENSAK